jgi:multimeric flavodoxin WrbA
MKTKRILGLVGSPRKLGNCEAVTKEIWRNIEGGTELRLIRMPSLRINPCKGCYACIMDKTCPQGADGMDLLLREIVSADALIITTPVYYLGAHSIYKQILDRAFLFYGVFERTYGKPSILINVYGIGERIGTSPQTLMTMATFLGLDIKASVTMEAALPGEIITKEGYRAEATRLAHALLSADSWKNESGCPYCGCEIVRMKGATMFVCTLCHGHFAVDGEGRRTKIKDGGILGTPEHMFRHREWLRGMKDRFWKNKRELLRALGGLEDVGQWIVS